MSTELIGIHVLLIEDEPDIAELLSFVLKDAGANVVIAISALEALCQLTRYSPHILVCNLRLPDMRGGDLLKYIRFEQPDASQQIPAIAVTSYNREIVWADVEKAGFERFLLKPIDPDQLVAEILSLVRC